MSQRMIVDYGVLHHAVTGLWSNKSKAELAQWFSDNGFARAYGNNPSNWSGLINPFTNQRSYSQTHAVGQRVDASTPDATAKEKADGYRVFYIVKSPEAVITWHAGDWTMNRRSMAIENLGDYRGYPLRDGDMRVIADFFRPLDNKVGGRMDIIPHNAVYATACPARISESIPKIINYINNPPKKVVVPNVTSYKAMEPAEYQFVRNANLWDFNAATTAGMKPVSSYKKGHKIVMVGKAIHKSGSEYYMTAYSFGDAAKTGKPKFTNGVNKVDLAVVAKDVVVVKTDRITKTTRFLMEWVEDSSLPVGETVVDVQGVDGVKVETYKVTYTNGKETSRVLDNVSVTQEMIVQVGRIGTKEELKLDPVDGEDANSWLRRLFAYIGKMLSNFKFKK